MRRTDPEAFRELFAKRRVSIQTVRYANPSDATATISGCEDGHCLLGVVVTRDNWRTESGVVLGGLWVRDLWTQPLGGGAVAVVTRTRRGKKPLPPFVFHPDGRITLLHISARPRDPRPGAVLTDRPIGARGIPGQVWVLTRSPARLSPAAHQPCCRQGEHLGGLEIGRHGVVSALIGDYDARSVDEWYQLVVSHDNGRSWAFDHDGLPDDYAPYIALGLNYVAGPGTRRAVAWSSDPGVDVMRFWLFVADDGLNWRRILVPEKMPKFVLGVAFTKDGTLLVSEYQHGLWRLRPGASTLERVRGDPRARYPVEPVGRAQPIVARIGPPHSFDVSRDGKHWESVEPGASLSGR